MASVSHYTIAHNPDSCIKCGACAERCVMHTIAMDAETGYPVVGKTCVGCGQCATVCPQGARSLKDKGYYFEMPDSLFDDCAEKYAARVRKGYVRDFDVM